MFLISRGYSFYYVIGVFVEGFGFRGSVRFGDLYGFYNLGEVRGVV